MVFDAALFPINDNLISHKISLLRLHSYWIYYLTKILKTLGKHTESESVINILLEKEYKKFTTWSATREKTKKGANFFLS